MNCPKCGDQIYDMTIEGVDIDFCSTCKGIWFDADEMAFIVTLQQDIPEIEEIRKNAVKTQYDCPRCADGTKLEEMKFIQAQDLLLDRCPQCQGIWLDKGEMIKVQKISARLGDLKSKVMLTSKHLKEKGYEVLGSRKG